MKTLNAPLSAGQAQDYYKSVSLAALVCADERIKEAYQQSVNEAVKHFEKYMQAHGGALAPGNGQHQDETESENDLTTEQDELDIESRG
jgi:hypothetical protein